ncbi:MAG: hypothetical protein RLT05_01005 [Bauldia litoralis]
MHLQKKEISRGAFQLAVMLRIRKALAAIDALPQPSSPNFYGVHRIDGFTITIARRPVDRLPVITHFNRSKKEGKQ